ncbi:DUF4192 domain-containing protein [Streptomyces sp. NPDC053755]|uniref:DUF4192 domain-containing protein n=1 Tax=Streptomyces sp. NPDC053755 TaxID=3155815 RepID=UPI00343BEC60
MNTNPHASDSTPSGSQQITLRSPAELADALPFMLGFHPTDSVVLVGLHGERGRFGGRVRLGIPKLPAEWPSTAEHLAECLVEGCARGGTRPDGIVVFLCQDPEPGETARHVVERLRPFAHRLRTACGELDIPVNEALCISDGLYFSYCCPDTRCCPPDGTPLALTGTSVMAAAAAYAGIQVRGTLREMQARLRPPAAPRGMAGGEEPPGIEEQRKALNATAARIVPKLLEDRPARGRQEVREATLALVRQLLRRFGAPAGDEPAEGATALLAAGRTEGFPSAVDPLTGRARPRGTAALDAADDALITSDEAASLILGLQDRETRDQAAEWMEGPEGAAAVRLWRALARRCVAPYTEHAAAPLTLAGWTAWSTGDEPAARVALGLALDIDPEYVFARLLHQACNEGLDPESLRSCLREERRARTAADPSGEADPRRPVDGAGATRGRTGGARPRTRVRTRPRAGGKGPRNVGVRPGPLPAKPLSGGAVRRGRRPATRSGR